MRSQIALAANRLNFMLQHPSSSCLGLFYLQARAAKSLATLAFNGGVFVEIVAIQNLQTIKATNCCLFDPFCNQKSAHRTTKTARHAVHWSTAVGARSCSRGHAARPPANTNNIKSCNPHAANQAVHTRQIRVHTKKSFVNAAKAYIRHLPSDAMGC